MEFKTTLPTSESRTFAVPLVGMPTVRTLLRSVSSIYEENLLSKSFSLIPDKLLKPIERPAIELAVELFTSSLLNSDLAKIFKSKYSIFQVHNLLRYTVVHISRKPSFPIRQTLKLAFGRFGAFGLQLSAKIGIPGPHVLDFLGVEEPVIRADCNIRYPTIYSKNFKIYELLRVIVLKRYMQIEHFISTVIGDRGRLDSPPKIISVMRWHKESRLDSSFGAGDRSQPTHKIHCDNSLIIPHCRERLSLWKSLAFGSLQRFASTVSGSLNQRRRKIWDALTGKLVSCFMVINLIPRLILKSPFCGDRERFTVSSHRVEESLTILVSQPKPECYRPKHIIYVGD